LMRKFYYDGDADISLLEGKTVAVIGFGNQGSAQAMNLRDSGVYVIVGNVEDDYATKARREGFEVMPIREAAAKGDIIMMLIPDEVQPEVYESDVKPNLRRGKTIVFASGYNIHFGLIKPPQDVDVVMLAPKMLGNSVRSLYLRGSGAPALIAVHNDSTGNALKTVLALAKGIGATRAGVIESSFEEETVTDLFSEHALAYGQLIKLAFEVLTEAGYDPVVVQLELYGSGEIVEIAKAIVRYGLVDQLSYHSTTSQFGQLSKAGKVVGEDIKHKMRGVLDDIRSGRFAREWFEEKKAGYQNFKRMLEEAKKHPLVSVEKIVRVKVRIDVDC